ncbi:unnamed protein product [Rhodiola kirilowii]
MQIFTSSSPNYSFTLFAPSQNPSNSYSNHIGLRSVTSASISSPFSQFHPLCSAKSREQELYSVTESGVVDTDSDGEKGGENELLVVRRPVKEVAAGNEEKRPLSSLIDDGLSEFAKKMPMFEPERVGSGSGEKLLTVNLDLALYKAKVLARSFRFDEAEKILEKCIYFWPENGRPYVALGKILSKQSKMAEARAVYEAGCQTTQGENPYIWQCWAVLENKVGNTRRARELFDAATVADKKHAAAWHGWAMLELKQGNIQKARNLLGKALKFCGGNEYVYQTLALLETRANRYEQARYLFKQATKCNPKSCASWLAWAQLEVQQENHRAARQLFESAVQASPKNRFAWHVWGVFEANLGNFEKGRKLLKIGHVVNPRDPVLLQSLALLEYKYSTANVARVLFRRASELDSKHQPIWIAWGWMEWKEGNITTAREMYQRALSIDSSSESAAHCLQAWGVLEQRVGNLSAARRLFRSSLNINSQSYVTWMTWASMEEDQGNSSRAEEIRNLYFQQRTEVVDDASWVMGLFDVIDPAIDSIKRLFKLEQASFREQEFMKTSTQDAEASINEDVSNGFDLDSFIKEKLSLDPSKLDIQMAEQMEKSAAALSPMPKKTTKVWRSSESKNTSNELPLSSRLSSAMG